MNVFEYSDGSKRYHTYGYYLKKRFGKKIYRVSLDIGAGCPNRCGERGHGGCIFCPAGSTPLGKFTGISDERLSQLFEQGKAAVGSKCKDGPFIAYFQAGTNTYGSLPEFEKAFDRALSYDNVVGLCAATRADCIDDAAADMLAGLAEKTYLTVELGLQTIHDSTAALCNRGHTFEEFMAGYERLKSRGINTGIHIINGLPEETEEMMLATAEAVAALRPHCVKIHMLYVEEGTPLAEMYRKGGIKLLSREEYVSIICSQIELMPPETVIARLTGDGDRRRFIAPEWTLHKLPVLNEIDKEFVRRDSYQGIHFKGQQEEQP